MFFEKIHSITMSRQPIKNNTRTLQSLDILVESNYKMVLWLKKFEKVYSSSFICASSGI